MFVKAKYSLHKALDAVYILPCTTFFFYLFALSPSHRREAGPKPGLFVVQRGW